MMWVLGVGFVACSDDVETQQVVVEPEDKVRTLLVTVQEPTLPACEALLVIENHDQAEPSEGVASDWVNDTEVTFGDQVLLAQLAVDEDGTAVLALGEDLFQGTQEDGTLTLSRTTSTVETWHADVPEVEYQSAFRHTVEEVHTLVLVENEDGDLDGDLEILRTTNQRWSESDTWRYDGWVFASGEAELPEGNFEDALLRYTDHDPQLQANSLFTTECSGALCFVDVEEPCRSTSTVVATDTALQASF